MDKSKFFFEEFVNNFKNKNILFQKLIKSLKTYLNNIIIN